jgi:eukaryotic-like serine/threonine-protein kinase
MNLSHPTTFRAGYFYFLIIVLLASISSCQKDKLPMPDDKHMIVSFELRNADGSVIDTALVSTIIQNDSISITVPAGTDITQLIPDIVITGVTISPATGVIQDFSNAVIYTVTAEDGSQGKYTVIIKAAVPLTESLVFFGSGDNNFYALNAKTGALKWKYTSTASFAYSSPTYKDGVIYVGGIDNYVYAFTASSGQMLWKYEAATTGIESDAVICGNTVYVGTNDDYLHAIHAQTGTLKWKFQTGSNVSSSPTIYKNLVCFGSSDGKMYALDTATGQQVWNFQTGAMINQSGASLVNGTLYVGSRDQHLYSIDALTGTMNWAFKTNVSMESSSPTVVDGIVYMGGWYDISNFSIRGSMYAVNANTGELIWEVLKNTGISSSPYVANGILYIGADDLYFYALNTSTGATLWRKQILTNSASASVADGVVYIGGGGTRNFYAFDAATGTEKWRFPILNGLMTSSPLVIDQLGEPHHAGDSGVQF